MKLAEMTVDEAIALACREVPECRHPAVRWRKLEDMPKAGSFGVIEFGVLSMAPNLTTTMPCYPWEFDNAKIADIARALWFDVAWEWLSRKAEMLTIEHVIDDRWRVWNNHNDEREVPQDFPSKHHSLAAACLLAAGKEVP